MHQRQLPADVLQQHTYGLRGIGLAVGAAPSLPAQALHVAAAVIIHKLMRLSCRHPNPTMCSGCVRVYMVWSGRRLMGLEVHACMLGSCMAIRRGQHSAAVGWLAACAAVHACSAACAARPQTDPSEASCLLLCVLVCVTKCTRALCGFVWLCAAWQAGGCSAGAFLACDAAGSCQVMPVCLRSACRCGRVCICIRAAQFLDSRWIQSRR